MRSPFYDPDDQMTVFDGVAVDDVTMARLTELSEALKVPQQVVIASIVRDVLEDDARQHDDGPDIIRSNANHDLN